jgi:hypothetical protein
MTVTGLTEVQYQIQKYWAPVFTQQLRENLLLGSLVNKDYQGDIKVGGDEVTVSQINAPTGALLTVGTDADAFSTEALSTSYVKIKADKRAVAAYEFEDLVALQSQISLEDSSVRDSLVYAMSKQINDYLYTLVNPSSSSPDHLIASVTDLNAAQVAALRVLAGQAKWPDNKPWYGLVDPQYFGDIMKDATLGSSIYGASDAPVIAGKLGQNRYGFTIFEDNSRAADYGLFFHPDFLHMVMQKAVSVKISDLHSQKKFGYILSVDCVFGAKLGIDGNKKHIKVYNT